MLTLEPVIEVSAAEGFAGWPVSVPAGSRLLPLTGGLTAREVGTFMAALAPRRQEGNARKPRQAAALLRKIITVDCLIVAGGLLVTDTATGLSIAPGCCCGLEDWRGWSGILSGGAPWLGHDPAPWIEHADGLVRLWPDGGMSGVRPPADQAIIIEPQDLPGLLDGVHRDLIGLLDPVEDWARDIAPALAGELVGKLDDSFHITRPIGPVVTA